MAEVYGYLYRCNRGHDFYVSWELLRQMRPLRCRCGRRLVKRVRPLKRGEV